MKILVTGATGALGTAVINTLTQELPAGDIAVLTRREAGRADFAARGFRAHLGDYDDPQALRRAMQGVATVLLIAAGDQGDRLQQHRNVIDAAVATGVGCIAYTSRALRDPATLVNNLMREHVQTEDYIRQSGLRYVIFRNSLYLDAIPLFVGREVLETGIYQPAGDGRVAYSLRAEQGEAMARVLLREDCTDLVYHFTGESACSYGDVAAALGRLAGREVPYHNVEVAAYRRMMEARGVPPAMIEKIVAFNADIRNDQESLVTGDLAAQLGRPPTALQAGLKLLFGL